MRKQRQGVSEREDAFWMKVVDWLLLLIYQQFSFFISLVLILDGLDGALEQREQDSSFFRGEIFEQAFEFIASEFLCSSM